MVIFDYLHSLECIVFNIDYSEVMTDKLNELTNTRISANLRI